LVKVKNSLFKYLLNMRLNSFQVVRRIVPAIREVKMAKNTRSKTAKLGDLKLLEVLTILRRDISEDYKIYLTSDKRKATLDSRYYVGIGDCDELQVSAFICPFTVAPLAFRTSLGAHQSREKHAEEWLYYFRAIDGGRENG
jgi:hypothetical protein